MSCALGDIGGYMGLLIGGSAITVIEFLDLVVYNVIRKCDEKRRARRQVQSIRGSSAKISDEMEPTDISTAGTLTDVERNEHGGNPL